MRGNLVESDGPGGVTRPPLARGESASAEREVPAVRRCPRCATFIEGEYRFCPSCAYRLRPGTEPEPEAPPPPPWKRGFVIAAATALLLAAFLVALLVLHPDFLLARGRGNPSSTPPESLGYAEPAFTVADIPGSMVELPQYGHVTVYSVDSLVLKPADEIKLEALLEDNPTDSLPVLIHYPVRVMKTEVTQGQYEEFLRDVEEHRENVPQVWIEEQRNAKRPEDVLLWRHIPEPWIVRDRDGEPVTWRVDPLARNLPVTYVSYYDARGFADWAGKRLGFKLVVPTEMEWTRAARAGRLTVPDPNPFDDVPADFWRWPWGAEPLIYACNNAQRWPGTGRPEYVHLVYSEPRGGGGGATPDGLMAMAGNVAEWAAEDDVALVPTPAFGAPAYITRADRGDTMTAYAMGGSFRDGIDDCQVDSKRRYPRNDDRVSRRDDLGFRLFVRNPDAR